MYPDLQKELSTFERRTPKSAEAHKKNLKRIPLGVASNYRHLRALAHLRKRMRAAANSATLDGNEYIRPQPHLRGAYGRTLPSPAVMKAVEKRLSTGTMFGMPHDMEWGTRRRNLQALSRRDVPLRQQRH